jgi:HPr kinase/phosphorylase
MINGKGASLQVKDLFLGTKNILRLHPASGRVGFNRKIEFRPSGSKTEAIEVWRRKVIQNYQDMAPNERAEFLDKKMDSAAACIILEKGVDFPQKIVARARRNKTALFLSGSTYKKCKDEIDRFLINYDPNKVIVSGGLLQVFGLGVLIIGDSGIGKSESALELISRGFRFVSDDVTQFERTERGKLVGKAPPLSRDFMEIRGLGIINIREIFGNKAICPSTDINLVVRLKRWERGKSYDRLGLTFPEDHEILGVKIPQISIPVAPGRNIATLIEVACKVQIVREKGYQASHEILKRLERALSPQ